MSARSRAVRILRPVVPTRARRGLRGIDRALDPALLRFYRRRTGEVRPIPPRGLRERNAVDTIEQWHRSAEATTGWLVDALAAVGARPEDFRRGLDFGCAAGKVVTSLRGRVPELYGIDMHRASVDWLAATYPDLRVVHGALDPPMPFADATFDLLWAFSVLTHLDAARQARWVAEWARVSEPAAVLVVTFNGPQQLARRRAEMPSSAEGELQRDGVCFVPYDLSSPHAVDFSGTSDGYGDTFNSVEQLTSTIEPWFDLVAHVPDAVYRNQDALVLRRR